MMYLSGLCGTKDQCDMSYTKRTLGSACVMLLYGVGIIVHWQARTEVLDSLSSHNRSVFESPAIESFAAP